MYLYFEINWAGPVPERYFLTKNIEKIAKKKNVKKVIVPKQACYEVKVEVKHCNMLLEWEYELKCHDIGFKILFAEKSAEGTEIIDIIPMYKFETDYEPIRGMLRCKKKGTYIIGFDNSYSWFNSKEVYYRIWQTTSKEEIYYP
ncbi:GOLD domain-containing protein [Nephila pilipes]|uniref:GOLD domain-containing protein n=1 Tax=Nephila pilipes TaxID=299642 RepID=A0A8X6MJR0_NEPPI|nr:GOLD domain-containing protein [Nephila pilipes]